MKSSVSAEQPDLRLSDPTLRAGFFGGGRKLRRDLRNIFGAQDDWRWFGVKRGFLGIGIKELSLNLQKIATATERSVGAVAMAVHVYADSTGRAHIAKGTAPGADGPFVGPRLSYTMATPPGQARATRQRYIDNYLAPRNATTTALEVASLPAPGPMPGLAEEVAEARRLGLDHVAEGLLAIETNWRRDQARDPVLQSTLERSVENARAASGAESPFQVFLGVGDEIMLDADGNDLLTAQQAMIDGYSAVGLEQGENSTTADVVAQTLGAASMGHLVSIYSQAARQNDPVVAAQTALSRLPRH